MSIIKSVKALNPVKDLFPGPLILLAMVLGVVIWATRSGTLPGSGMHFPGYASEVVFWACMYAGLGKVYRQPSRMEGRSVRSLLGRIGFCLLLSVASTHAVMLLLTPTMWDKLFYIRYLSPTAFVGLWCISLLPRETRTLHRIAETSKIRALLLPGAILLVAAAFFVCCSDLALQFGVTSGSGLQRSIIKTNAWVTNIIILFAAYALAFVITSRLATALLFVSPFFVVLGVATLLKLKYMHAAVSPLDLISLPEFLPQFETFFGTWALAATICVFIVWIVLLVILRRTDPYRIPLGFRMLIAIISVVVLLAVPAIYFFFPPGFEASNEKLLRRIGAPEHHLTREFTRESGYLLTFLSEIPSSFIVIPSDYSPATVAIASRKFKMHEKGSTGGSNERKVNLIVYMVESFMDPNDLGLSYTSDPIPNFRLLQRAGAGGYAIVPEPFGGSINSEFEALTGMTISFLPERSLPFRQFVKNPMPSLPNALKQKGYRSIAVQSDPKNWFNREKVYDLLGFDKVVWLHEAQGIERASSGWWPTDKAVVESVIQASQGARPFFIFAFPSATHAPYNSGIYRNSDLDVLNHPPGDSGNEVKEYINALRVSDRAIGTLIEYFRRQSYPTIIAITGDHLPPLSGEAYHLFDVKLSDMSKAEQAFKIRRVPLLIWSNFDLHTEKTEISLNALPSLLFEEMKILCPSFFAVSDAIREELPIISKYIKGADGSVWDRKSLPIEAKTLLEQYRLLQYDVLLGKQYSITN